MSEDDWQAWIVSTPSLAKITSQELASALEGFPLTPRRSIEWLARALQGALLFTGPLLPEMRHPETEGPCLLQLGSPTQLRDRYVELATRADEFATVLNANLDLIRHTVMSDEALAELLTQVGQAALAFNQRATDANPSKPRFRSKRARADRVDFARALAPVFRLGFEREPTWNDWPGSEGGPWPDFYQRIAKLVFGEEKTKDLRSVLKDARRQEWTEESFSPGQLPEYPL